MWNKWFKNLSQKCQFLNKWRSKEAEAHPSQTSQKSLAWEFHLAGCSDSFFFSPLPFSYPHCFLVSSQLVICSLIPPCSPSGRCIITTIPVAFTFTSSQLAQAKKPLKPKSLKFWCILCGIHIQHVCMLALCKQTPQTVTSWCAKSQSAKHADFIIFNITVWKISKSAYRSDWQNLVPLNGENTMDCLTNVLTHVAVWLHIDSRWCSWPQDLVGFDMEPGKKKLWRGHD